MSELAGLFDAASGSLPGAERIDLPGVGLRLSAPADYRRVAADVAGEVASVPRCPGPDLEVGIAVIAEQDLLPDDLVRRGATDRSSRADVVPAHRVLTTDGERFDVITFRDGAGAAAFWQVFAPARRQVLLVSPGRLPRRELASFRVLLYELVSLRTGLRPVHAEGVRVGEAGCLVVGAAGAGKTTLAFGLARHGARLLSADLSLATSQGLLITRAPEPLQIGAGALLHFATAGRGPAGSGPRAIVTAAPDLEIPVDSGSWWDLRLHAPSCRISRVYFPAVGAGPAEFVELAPEEALARLEAQVLPFPLRQPVYESWGDPPAGRTFWDALLRNGARAYRVSMSHDAEAAVRAILQELDLARPESLPPRGGGGPPGPERGAD